jgi:hypothetical protein
MVCKGSIARALGGLPAGRRLVLCNATKPLTIYCALHIKRPSTPMLRGVSLRRPNEAERGSAMTTPNFEEFQKFSKHQLDAVNAATATVAKGLQEIAAESFDYTKNAFAAGSAAMEKLLGSKSIESAIQIQTEYAKSAYEGFVAEASKINEICLKVATEAFKPVETALANAHSR